MKTVEFILPVYWASALINDDCSGLDVLTEREMREFCVSHNLKSCIDVSEESFTYCFDGLITNCATYTFYAED